jgi:hypothetical protein
MTIMLALQLIQVVLPLINQLARGESLSANNLIQVQASLDVLERLIVAIQNGRDKIEVEEIGDLHRQALEDLEIYLQGLDETV